MKKPRILALRNCYSENPTRRKADGYGATGYYRSVKPAVELAKEFEVTAWGRKLEEIEDNAVAQWTNVFTNHDVIWMRYFDSAVVASAVFGGRDYFKKKVIVDIDDNYLDVPLSNPQYEHYKEGKHKRAHVGAIFSLADALTVSTEPLKARLADHLKRVQGIDKPIFVIPNYNDLNDWAFPKATLPKDRITIGYTGSVSHDDDLMLVLPAIKNLMTKYPNLYFQILGIVRNGKHEDFFGDFPQELRNRIEIVGATHMFSEYPEWLAFQKWDIGIAPLVDSAFTRCKSHIKWMEYSMFQIPVVASRVYPYFMELEGKDTIVHDETGLLSLPHEWEKNLELLITNEKKRKELGKNAYEFVKTTWQYKDAPIVDTFKKMLDVI